MRSLQEINQLLERKGTEIDFTRPVCDIFSDPNPPTLDGKTIDHWKGGWDKINIRAREAGNQGLQDLAIVMSKWVAGFKRKNKYTPDDVLRDMKKILGSCSNLAGWMRFSGKVYRGNFASTSSQWATPREFPSSFKVTKISRMKATNMVGRTHSYVVAEGMMPYTTSLPAQSWSRDYGVAVGFATGDFKGASEMTYPYSGNTTGYVLEYNIPAKESLNLVRFGNPDESEVIRLSNAPIQCKCDVIIGDSGGYVSADWFWENILTQAQRDQAKSLYNLRSY